MTRPFFNTSYKVRVNSADKSNMKWIIISIFLLQSAPIAFAGNKECKHSATELNCAKYINNYDGDTISFNIPNTHPIIGKKVSIRLNGVDTPELKTKDQCEKQAARRAKKLTKSLLKRANSIKLKNIRRGKYFS